MLSRSVAARRLFKPALRMFAAKPTFEKFDFMDPFKFEELLTEEEVMIMETAHEYS